MTTFQFIRSLAFLRWIIYIDGEMGRGLFQSFFFPGSFYQCSFLLLMIKEKKMRGNYWNNLWWQLSHCHYWKSFLKKRTPYPVRIVHLRKIDQWVGWNFMITMKTMRSIIHTIVDNNDIFKLQNVFSLFCFVHFCHIFSLVNIIVEVYLLDCLRCKICILRCQVSILVLIACQNTSKGKMKL